MDIKPTLVEVKDIVILDDTNYGENVIIQVLGYENATAPLSVPYAKLLEFAEKIESISLGVPTPIEPPTVDDIEPNVPEENGPTVS